MKKILFFFFFSLLGLGVFAQNITLTGVVTAADDGQPLPGVSIVQKGTTNGTITDMNGNYQLEVSADAFIQYSFIGMQTKEIAVDGRNEINVVLESAAFDVDEVVVVGYGVQKKSLVTGAISKVESEDLSQGANLKVTQALQGKTAGVVITNNSGQPGDLVSVRIRGTGTNGNPEPLYIVDGLPMSGEGIDFLNPSDIESVEVLKDAAASSIYGARGANGVVLITTKSGEKGKDFTLTYDGYYGVQNPWKKLSMLDKEEYVMLINEAALNAGQDFKFPPATQDELKWNTDWQDEMFYYNAPKQNHSVSMTGGSEKSTYSSSLSYFKQDGIVAKGQSEFDRLTFRLNTTTDLDFVLIGSNINYANIKNKGIAANDQYASSSLIQALNAPPVVPVRFDDGTYATPSDFGLGMQEITNPIAMLDYSNSKTVTNKFIGGLFAEFDFAELSEALKGLKFKSSYGMEFSLVDNSGYTPEYYLDPTHNTIIDRANKSMDKYNRWNIENILTYDRTIDEHHFTALAGHAAFKYWYQNVGGSKTDLIFDDFEHAFIDNAQDPESDIVFGGYSENTLLSYFGRINYDFMNRYMLTAVLRMDGSSRFGPANKFGYFPSASAGWVLSEEPFMDFIKPVVDFMKLRVSWGQNGNEEIGNFRYTSVMSTGAIYYFGDDKTQYNGAQPSRIANPNLRWETSEQTNIGLDLGLIDNKMRVGLDYYNKKTIDWLVDAPAPLMVGNTPPTVNGGSVRNAGFEMEVGYIENIGKFNFDISLNGAYNKNEVLDINNEEKRLSGGTGGHGQENILVAEVGKPLGYFHGYRTDGIFQNEAEVNAHVGPEGELVQPNAVPGDIRFVDQDGNGSLDDNDRVNLGNPYPDFTGGLNISMDYAGFDLNFLLYAALGQEIWDATRRYDLNYSNYRSEYLNRWTGEGSTNAYPRVTLNDANNNWKTPSDFFVKDADYLRMRNITLGYTIPEKATNYLKIHRVRLYVSGENLLTLTKYPGYDPEIGGGALGSGIDQGIYPQARTVLGGINITF